MTMEDRVRAALHAEAGRVDVDAHAWAKVQDRVARQRRWGLPRKGVVVLAAAAMIAVGLGVAALVTRDDSQDVRVGSPFADDSSTSTTQPVPSTAVFAGIWPFASEAEVEAYKVDPGVGMFLDAEATALEFARVYLGMPDPEMEGTVYASADFCAPEDEVPCAGSWVVFVRAKRESPVLTRVHMQQFGGDHGPYSVVSAVTNNIQVTVPWQGDTVAREVKVAGRSTAFEGTVQVEVREDRQAFGENIGSSFVTGGSMGDLAPFSGTVTIDEPTEPAGAVTFFTESAEDGSVQEATVVRIGFGSEATPFSVFFHRAEELVEIEREVPRTAGVLRAALTALFEGPQPEDGAGLSSLFSEDTADLLGGVVLRSDGTAIVDLTDTVPNASASAASQEFLAELNATAFQFETVQRIEYRLDGSCDAFWQWLQYGECRVVDR